MKILSLQLKNLNSLYGEWFIDFTDKTYQNDGLFVLSGPTGAGKSTILDAVCLALYGQTPRLGKITQTNNEVMSKHTADCYSLLHFETKGIQYYARFEQRKAKNNPNGKLQDVERSIAKEKPDSIICRKKTEINEEIIRITGMDFPRFTRSILLAQGAFDSFLKARDEEKSMLLEQITGTEIYSEISQTIYQRAKSEKEKKERLILLANNTSLLPPEEIEKLKNRQETHNQELATINQQLSQIRAFILWHNQMQELQEKNDTAKNQHKNFLEQKKASEEKAIQLIKAEKAEKLYPEYHALNLQEKEIQNAQASLTELEKNLPKQETQLKLLIQKIEEIHNNCQQEKINYEKLRPLFEEIKKLDIELENINKNIQAQSTEIAQSEKEKQKIASDIQEIDKKNAAIRQEQDELSNWFQTNTCLETLKQELSAIKNNLIHLDTIIESGKQTKNKIAEQEEELKHQKTNNAKQEQSQKELIADTKLKQKQQKQITGQIETLLKENSLQELKTTLSFLEEKKFLLAQISALEEQRKTLREGEECPLCGSIHHPFMQKDAIIPSGNSDIDIDIKQLKHQIEEIEKLKQEQDKIDLLLAENNKRFENIGQTIQDNARQIMNKEKLIQEFQKERNELLKQYNEEKETLLQQVKPFNITEIIPNKNQDITEILEGHLKNFDMKNKQKQDIEQKLQENEKQLASLQTQLAVIQNNLTYKNGQLQTEKNTYSSIKRKREKDFAQKNPQTEEEKLLKSINELEEKKEKILQEKDKQNQEVTQSKEQINHLQAFLAEKSKNVSMLKEEFLQKLQEQEFSDVEDFLKAQLSKEELQHLQHIFKELEQNIKLTQSKLAESEKELQTLKNKNLTAGSKQELEEQEKNIREKQEASLVELGEIQGKLKQNQEIANTYNEKLQKLKKHEHIQAKWYALNSLVGSDDGKKFRQIAQAITFEQVLHYANMKLQLLQKRYLLIQDKNNLLNLNVLDNYQGGEIRAVQNLSGGESFIVSLSLALGLAQMASKNVRVDSLFLDEGFGTLDEENLDTALSTLASIQQEGKLIGIISHIPLLKERINTQINVIPEQGGRSILQGAGCKKLH
ncbi:MAG: AAA family ATPase [Mailhella sp.]